MKAAEVETPTDGWSKGRSETISRFFVAIVIWRKLGTARVRTNSHPAIKNSPIPTGGLVDRFPALPGNFPMDLCIARKQLEDSDGEALRGGPRGRLPADRLPF